MLEEATVGLYLHSWHFPLQCAQFDSSPPLLSLLRAAVSGSGSAGDHIKVQSVRSERSPSPGPPPWVCCWTESKVNFVLFVFLSAVHDDGCLSDRFISNLAVSSDTGFEPGKTARG